MVDLTDGTLQQPDDEKGRRSSGHVCQAVTQADWETFARLAADLADQDVVRDAWR